ncbi:major facilitator superfamily domain-containing protein [Hysterangium stoloniferum]|nr:major facilitator superfamily domain-containing protein [Hysterangium stoloniferum]
MAELTPLLDELQTSTLSRTHDVYDRFTPPQKRLITSLIATAGLIDYFSAGSFLPCVPAIAKDLNTTGVIIGYTIGAYKLALVVGILVGAPYAGFYGRRPVYLISLPLLFIGALICAGATNVSYLVIGRGFQALGSSCITAVGASVISDIYKLEERGTAMGFFFAAILLAPPLAPLLGGWLATYASWRVVQLCISIMGFICFVFVVISLPETSHPGTKGIEKLRAAESLGWGFITLNPLRILLLLKNPMVASQTLQNKIPRKNDIFSPVIMLPLSYTLGPQYGMDTPALIGLCFLPAGLGDIAGALIAGRLADIFIIRGRRRRQGKWFPEDRLLAAVPGLVFLLPCSLIAFALLVAFVPGKIGLTLSLICLFFTGMGVDMVLGPCSTYLVDVFHSQGAEVVAVSMAARNAFGAIATSAVLPMVNQFGIIATNTTTAALVWLACILLYVTIKEGDRLRAWAGMD